MNTNTSTLFHHLHIQAIEEINNNSKIMGR